MQSRVHNALGPLHPPEYAQLLRAWWIAMRIGRKEADGYGVNNSEVTERSKKGVRGRAFSNRGPSPGRGPVGTEASARD